MLRYGNSMATFQMEHTNIIQKPCQPDQVRVTRVLFRGSSES